MNHLATRDDLGLLLLLAWMTTSWLHWMTTGLLDWMPLAWMITGRLLLAGWMRTSLLTWMRGRLLALLNYVLKARLVLHNVLASSNLLASFSSHCRLRTRLLAGLASKLLLIAAGLTGMSARRVLLLLYVTIGLLRTRRHLLAARLLLAATSR